MPSSPRNSPQAGADLRAIYEEICRAHDGIADFRAKLLALLPIASGAGIFLLLDKDVTDAKMHLFSIGVFGALVSFGLYLYELRGIQRCEVLTRCGQNAEQAILRNANCLATFTDEPPAAFCIVGNIGAALIVYPAFISAWAYVATQKSHAPGSDGALHIALGTFVFLVVFGILVVWRQRCILKRFAENCPSPVADDACALSED